MAIRETPFTQEAFALALACEYNQRVPADVQTLEWPEIDRHASIIESGRLAGKLRKRVERAMDGSVRIPCELEEAWAYALPEPYGERCRHELAWRYGFIGAVSLAAEPCPDAEIMGRLLSEAGRTTSALARALADGEINPADVSDGEIEDDLRGLEAAVASIRARVQCVRDALSSPGGSDHFSDRRQRVRAAKAAH
ncbi:MAG: hypothetical protein PF501_07565 [Salinisphaera sp.]|nr:hypothetical protein [Salinisphaera sp.]